MDDAEFGRLFKRWRLAHIRAMELRDAMDTVGDRFIWRPDDIESQEQARGDYARAQIAANELWGELIRACGASEVEPP